MEVHFSLDREDYWQFYRFMSARSRGRTWTFVALTIVGSAALGGWLLLSYKSLGLAALATVLTALALLWFGYFSGRRRVKNYFAGRPGMLGEHQLSIGPDGLRDVTPISDGRRSWAGIMEIADSPRAVYLFIERYVAFMIPKRAFADADEAQRFIDLATQYWRAAQTSSGGVASSGQ